MADGGGDGNALTNEVDREVLPWLKVAEDLRALSLESELNVPQVCVMGDQSSGKSSVLNLLAGDMIFPSGTGLVTRCPIRLVMRKARAGERWAASVSTSVAPGKRADARDVPGLYDLIAQATTTLCKGATNFSTDTVVVDLVSPDACDLTVVDLPGIVRTVTSGQSASVIDDVNALITAYLSDKRTIILAVIPANQDIATVDILERAQRVDPAGERTLGVLTKVDLVNPGGEDEVLAVVNNVRKPLALGYIMVKNRSQMDMNKKMTTAEARAAETAYFKAHETYRQVETRLWGVGQLARRLTSLLVTRIQLQLAPMKAEVEKQLAATRAELRTLSAFGGGSGDVTDRQKLLVAVMQEFVRHLTDSVRGEYRDRIMVRHADLRLYTLALQMFEGFQTRVAATAPPFRQQGYLHTLAAQIEQLRGRELPGFMSSQAFYMSMSQYADAWGGPSAALISDVRGLAQDVAGKLADVLLVQYPSLRDAIRAVAARVLNEAADEATKKVADLLAREKDPFTVNDFLQQWVNKRRVDRFNEAVNTCFDNAKTPASNWAALKDEVFQSMRQWYRSTHSVSPLASAQDMCAILEAYWTLSSKRFVDNVCMVVDREVMGKLSSSMQEQMFRFVRDDSKLESFFTEDPLLVQKRGALESRRDRLTQASTALAKVQARPSSTPGTPQTTPMKGLAAAAAAATTTSSSSAGGGGGGGGGKSAVVRLTLTVSIGAHGIGLVVTDDDTGSLMVVKDLRKMPGNLPNPSEAAGVRIGDVVERINNVAPASLKEAVAMLKSSNSTVTLTVLRKQ